MKKHIQNRSGFTLVEIIVAVLILTITIAAVFPALFYTIKASSVSTNLLSASKEANRWLEYIRVGSADNNQYYGLVPASPAVYTLLNDPASILRENYSVWAMASQVNDLASQYKVEEVGFTPSGGTQSFFRFRKVTVDVTWTRKAPPISGS